MQTRRFAVRAISAALCILLLAATGFTGWGMWRAAADPSVSVTQDSLTPTTVVASQNSRAVLKVHSNSCFTAERLTVAVRSDSGTNLDYPGAVNNVRICPSGYALTTGQRAFPAGEHEQFGSYRYNGKWYPLPTRPLTSVPAPEPTATDGPAGVAGAWSLAKSDEFDGTSLNTSLWQPGWFGSGITKPVSSGEAQCYDSTQVTVSGGSLHLTAQARSVSCGGVNRNYASGMVSSNPSVLGRGSGYQFTYGVAEARIWLQPDGAGKIANWPAFWTDGQNWPSDGEIDVLEGLGGNASWHVHSPTSDAGASVPGVWPGGWHTYAAHWYPGRVDFYYDAVRVGSTAYDRSSPNYLILNQAVGSFGGTTVVPADMQVDWVRVWQ